MIEGSCCSLWDVGKMDGPNIFFKGRFSECCNLSFVASDPLPPSYLLNKIPFLSFDSELYFFSTYLCMTLDLERARRLT